MTAHVPLLACLPPWWGFGAGTGAVVTAAIRPASNKSKSVNFLMASGVDCASAVGLILTAFTPLNLLTTEPFVSSCLGHIFDSLSLMRKPRYFNSTPYFEWLDELQCERTNLYPRSNSFYAFCCGVRVTRCFWSLRKPSNVNQTPFRCYKLGS